MPVVTRPNATAEEDPRFAAAVDMLRRTGASEFQVRYCDEEKPVVWIAAGRWGDIWQAAGAMTPLVAVFRLCESVIDGGTCKHCKRPTGFSEDPDTPPMDQLVCWYVYDPGAKKFIRGCD